jgi:hypothetical protein
MDMDSDFDRWFEEHKGNKEKLEQYRVEQFNKMLDNATPERQQQLRQLQWRIDVEIAKAKTPMKAAIVLNRIMLEKFHELNDTLNHLHEQMIVAIQPPQPGKPSLRLVENIPNEM